MTEELRPQLEEVFEKMSKSKGNGVSPAEAAKKYGVDVCRLAMLFKAPPERDLEWSADSLTGPQRWLHRLWGQVMHFVSSEEEGGGDGVAAKSVEESLSMISGGRLPEDEKKGIVGDWGKADEEKAWLVRAQGVKAVTAAMEVPLRVWRRR